VYALEGENIVVSAAQFRPRAVLECGQVFRFRQIDGSDWEIISGDKRCLLAEKGGKTVISAAKADIPYFINYFDLERDYRPIIRSLRRVCARGEPPLELEHVLAHGKGLRLLRQDKWETLLSFIISTNNNIPRIRGIIEKLCAALGKKRNGFYAFPTAKAMAAKDEGFYRKAGCGYRAPWLAAAAKKAAVVNLEALDALPTGELVGSLMAFDGIGPKAADCIALFAYGRFDTFPVDTWVKKIYRDLFPSAEGAGEKTMRRHLIERFGEYAGAAQQFLFYHYRENKK